jgi:hypothetical protein
MPLNLYTLDARRRIGGPGIFSARTASELLAEPYLKQAIEGTLP